MACSELCEMPPIRKLIISTCGKSNLCISFSIAYWSKDSLLDNHRQASIFYIAVVKETRLSNILTSSCLSPLHVLRTCPDCMSYHYLTFFLVNLLDVASNITLSLVLCTPAKRSTRCTQIWTFFSSDLPNSGIWGANNETTWAGVEILIAGEYSISLISWLRGDSTLSVSPRALRACIFNSINLCCSMHLFNAPTTCCNVYSTGGCIAGLSNEPSWMVVYRSINVFSCLAAAPTFLVVLNIFSNGELCSRWDIMCLIPVYWDWKLISQCVTESEELSR